MHASSYENMQKCHDRYFLPAFGSRSERISVIDIGSADVNGSYRSIFANAGVDYRGVDLAPAPGVDLVLESPYSIPIQSASVDLVICGQMLEHCEYFWQAFDEMLRLLKPEGMLFLIAPSAGPIHQYPVDCYRFYPDAYRALAKRSGCHLLDVWLDERGPWRDLVGVFSLKEYHRREMTNSNGTDPIGVSSGALLPDGYTDSPERDVMRGERSYLDVLRDAHEVLKPSLYVEIGVRRGDSLALARGDAIGIDPEPEVTEVLSDRVRLFRRTSDDFFEMDASRALAGRFIEMAFIDGMHLFEYVLRDLINIEKYATDKTVVIVDDIYPNHPDQATRRRSTRVWTGDVWKIVPCLERYRPDLRLWLLDTHPAGNLVITGLTPGNRILVDHYNPIVREYVDETNLVPSAGVLHRIEAMSASRKTVSELFEVLASKKVPA